MAFVTFKGTKCSSLRGIEAGTRAKVYLMPHAIDFFSNYCYIYSKSKCQEDAEECKLLRIEQSRLQVNFKK